MSRVYDKIQLIFKDIESHSIIKYIFIEIYLKIPKEYSFNDNI